MNNDLSYIESYFNDTLSDTERSAFEQRLLEDPELARQVGFYLTTVHAIRESYVQERKDRFRQLYQPIGGKVRRIWMYVSSAAAALVIMFGAFLFRSASAVRLADEYIDKNLGEISVTMGTTDSLTHAKELYNQDKLSESLVIFQALSRDSLPADPLKFSGFVYLRQSNYDKAIACFLKIEKSELQSNPGAFYHALTLMKRNAKGDKEAAISLLKTVADNQLAYANVAAGWLKKLK